MRILFWNTHRNVDINSYILDIVNQNEIDVLVLAEYMAEINELNDNLKQCKKRLFNWNTKGCERIHIWGNYIDVTPGEQNKYFSVQIVNKQYIMCGVHMYSNLNGEHYDERVALAEEIMYSIKHIKQRLQTEHVIVIGDINESPYEKACLSAKGFHALPALQILDNNSKKEHKKILEQMHQVDKAESLILIATGSLVGEGFDFPRLDTLFMATPVSFRGVVEQYAGRLNRDYAGKENVIIYDYVDNHITMFNNMYMKRLKAYKQIGYEIAGGLHNDKQTANAIYDGDNYAENYHKDLLDANKNIIISSPAISGTKVYELINLLKEKQLSGVQITIVTWAPDSYGFGDASYWMQLHEEMRKAGFYIKTVEESCERFAVIDQEVVWYGNINLLAKDKVDDSIMRVLSKEIASELMEITFGDNG